MIIEQFNIYDSSYAVHKKKKKHLPRSQQQQRQKGTAVVSEIPYKVPHADCISRARDGDDCSVAKKGRQQQTGTAVSEILNEVPHLD